MQDKIIYTASDHAGFDLKVQLIDTLHEWGYQVEDLGVSAGEKADYPNIAEKLAHTLKDHPDAVGLLLCGTGIGMSIAINRYDFIRGTLVHDAYTAEMARQHNNANVLILGGRTTGPEIAKQCLKIFLETEFAGGRHAKRVEKLSNMC